MGVGQMRESKDLLGDAGVEVCFETVTGGMHVAQVEVEHTSGADYFKDPLGRPWVRKVDMGWQELLAELVGWYLGNALGVPQPHGAFFKGPGTEVGWLSALISSPLHWNGAHAHFVKNLEGLGAMLTLDALIHNHDRHAKNILLTSMGDELDVWAWAIDAGASLVGYPQDFSDAGLSIPEKPNLARGLPVGLLEVGAYKAAKRAAELAGSVMLRQCVQQSCMLVGESGSDLLFSALSRRMEQATQLVERYIQVVGAIR
jgi:hypothetical protein